MSDITHLGPIPGDLVCAAYSIHPEMWADMDPSDRALFRMAYATDFWHVQEDGAHTNHGPEVERCLKLCGLGPGNAWCSAQYMAYLMDSGVPRSKLPENAASVHGVGEWAEEHGRLLKAPIRGCGCLIYHTLTTGHFTVASNVATLPTVHVIAGNTNDDGSRDGFEDCRKAYPVTAFARFVDFRGLGIAA